MRIVRPQGSSPDPNQNPSDEEILRLFEGRRPNPESFTGRVQQRIQEREQEPRVEPSAKSHRAHPSPWTQVAASLSVKSSGFKISSAPFLWPLFLLLASMGSFYYGHRSLSKSLGGATGEQEPSRRRSKERTGASNGMGWLAALVFGVPLIGVFFGKSWGTELVLFVALLAVLGLVLVVRELRMEGVVNRREVSEVTMVVLIGLVVSGLFQAGVHSDITSHIGPARGWALIALIVGAVLCKWISGQRGRSGRIAVWGLVFLSIANPFSCTRTAPEDLQSQLESMAQELDVNDLRLWRKCAALQRALISTGTKTPDLSFLTPRLRQQIQAQGKDHPVVWSAAIDMGLLTHEDLTELAESRARSIQQIRRSVELKLAGERSGTQELRSVLGLYRYRFRLLVATEDLDPPMRAALAQMVLDLWPKPGEFQALRSALACVELLEVLDRDDLVTTLQVPATKLLSDYWIRPSMALWHDPPGGFMTQPEEHPSSSHATALQAVELMARFGVPEDVDPYLLHSHLRHSCSQRLFLSCSPYAKSFLDAESKIALFRFEQELQVPARSWMSWLLAQRILFVILAVVTLCVSAVYMAPKSLEQVLDDAKGAMP